MWIIEKLGFILVAVSVFGFLVMIFRARFRIRREQAEERQRAEEQAARIRAAELEKARAAAEKQAADNARKANAEQKKAARAAELEKARAEKAKAREERETANAAKRAERLETARLMAEYRERALQAARELAALQAPPAAAPGADPGQRPETISAADPAPGRSSAPADDGPKPLAGQNVAFTGKLRTMNRASAAELVRKAGGKAFIKSMPACTTLLVVGDVSGDGNTGKLDKAEEWCGQVRKMYEPQFLQILKGA